MLTLLRRAALLVAATVAALLAAARRRRRGQRPLVTGVQDFDFTADALRPRARRPERGDGEDRCPVEERSRPTAPPADFDPGEPGRPALRLGARTTTQVRAAVATRPGAAAHDRAGAARGPSGARTARRAPGTRTRCSSALFGEAVARRYSGTVAGLPRVRHVRGLERAQRELLPVSAAQRRTGSNYSPALYREMVNSFCAGVHRVHADNVVIAGAQFPFMLNRAERAVDRALPLHARRAVPDREAEDGARLRAAAGSSTCGATTPTRPAARRTGPANRDSISLGRHAADAEAS